MILHIRGDLSDYGLYGVIIIRIKGEGMSPTLAGIESVWKKINPGIPFEYSFLDSSYDRLYRAEKRLSTMFNTFSLLAVLISCIGLLGLASFMAENKTKEIGIRKVLGASVGEVAVLLSRQFFKWVLMANVIAWPLAYTAMNNWLENFAYRIGVALWIFPATAGLTLAAALLTVGYQSLRAALTNPINALRYE